MKKSKGLLALTALLFLMSSCVYSLFPIYTEDTLVFLPELIGKWQTNSTGDYIEFAAATSEDTKRIKVNKSEIKFTMNDDSDGNPETYNYEIKGKDWVARSDDPIKVEVNGELIDDPEAVKAYYDSLFGSVKPDAESTLGIMANKLDSAVNSKGNELGNVMNNLSEGFGKLGAALKDVEAKVKGSSMISKKESYKMTVVEDGVPRAYLVHVVEIGEDYFLDIYPTAEFTNETISENLFPVHTFMKMNLKDGQLKLTSFDLNKLKELFKSNLVRLRHEYVDGNIVITAQPQEIQKFLDKYSNDDTVFEEEEIYSKVTL